MEMNKKVIIEGEKVHHVGFRPFLTARARRLRIPNYEAENVEEDGKQRVIVLVGGDEQQVQEFVEFVKDIGNRPPKARVSRAWEGDPPEYVMPIDEYDKVLAAEQRNTIVQAGLGMVEMQKETIRSINQGFEKTDQNFATLGDKIDSGFEKTDQNLATLGDKIDSGFEKTDQDFQIMRSDYGKISGTMEKINDNLEKLIKTIIALVGKKS